MTSQSGCISNRQTAMLRQQLVERLTSRVTKRLMQSTLVVRVSAFNANSERLKTLPAPLLAVLIGRASNKHSYSMNASMPMPSVVAGQSIQHLKWWSVGNGINHD